MHTKSIAIIAGGVDLLSGFQPVSQGARLIREGILTRFDDVVLLHYNYFFDLGRSLNRLNRHLRSCDPARLILYGYSKGGELMLKLSRMLDPAISVDLLLMIDTANGPWSRSIDRSVPLNVRHAVNVYQTKRSFPLMSSGAAAHASNPAIVTNIDLTTPRSALNPITHGNFQQVMAPFAIQWINAVATSGSVETSEFNFDIQ